MNEIKQGRGFGVVKKLRQKSSPTGESKFWYILYSIDGRKMKENTKTEDWQEAYDLLVQRKLDAGRGVQPAKSQVIFRWEDMREMLLSFYRDSGAILHTTSDGQQHFRGRPGMDVFFRGLPVSSIDTAKIAEYVEHRRAEGAKGPSIRRELACLSKGFTLAKQAGRIAAVPYIQKPADSAPAGVIISPEDFEKILANMPEVSRAFFVFAHQTACRPGTIAKITWSMVNKECTEICLPAAIIKNRNPLTLPLVGKELEALSALLRSADKSGPVFYSQDYKQVWQRACVAAGVAHFEKRKGLNPKYCGPRCHDLRVAGARALVRAGIDTDTAMKIGGWKTQSVFSRYNIVSTEDVAAALRKRAG